MTVTATIPSFTCPPMPQFGSCGANIANPHERNPDCAANVQSAHNHPTSGEEQAPSRPSTIFERRGRGGIACVKMDVIKPFKARVDGDLALLSAPATHIRLGSTETGAGLFFTCIDIHTYEYFLMKDKTQGPTQEAGLGHDSSAYVPHRGQDVSPPVSTQSSGGDTEASRHATPVPPVHEGIESQEASSHAGSRQRKKRTVTSRAWDTASSWPNGIQAQSFQASGRSTNVLTAPGSSHSPSLSETWSTSPAVEEESASAPSSAGCRRLGCMRGRGCVIVSSSSPEAISPLTPRNVDAATSLWTLPARPETALPAAKAGGASGVAMRGIFPGEGRDHVLAKKIRRSSRVPPLYPQR